MLGAISALLPLLAGCGSSPAGIPAEPAPTAVLESRSICGFEDESEDVNSYSGTLGPTSAFVQRHKGPVGAMELTGADSSKKYCSGTLIGVSLFLTAGHCITSSTVGHYVAFNYEREAGSTTTLLTQRHYRITAVLENGYPDNAWNDYAILRLEGTPGYEFGIARVRSTNPALNSTLTILQHPAGEPKLIAAGSLDAVDGHEYLYGYIDTRNGSSGAGILDNQGLLVGVHTTSGCTEEDGYNRGVRMGRIRMFSPIINALASLSDGTVVREEGRTALYVIQGGARFWVPGSAQWEQWKQATGATDASVRTVPAGILNDVPEVPQHGTAVQELGKSAIWVFQGGGRFWVPGSNEWTAWSQATGVSTVQPVPAGSLWATVSPDDTHYRLRKDLPRDGTVVREVGKGAIWVYQGGGAFWAPSTSAWNNYRVATGTNGEGILAIPTRSLSEKLVDVNGTDQWLPRKDLPSNGTVVREWGQASVWMFQGEGKFLFPDPTEFDAWAPLGVTATSVRTIPAGSLSETLVDVGGTDAWRARTDVPSEHTLLRERSSTQTYVIRGGSRYLVTSETQAQAYGYSLTHTLRVPNTSLGPINYAGPLP